MEKNATSVSHVERWGFWATLGFSLIIVILVIFGAILTALDMWDVPLAKLVDHIESTHHEYVKSATPSLLELAKKVAGVHGDHHPELMELKEKVMALAEDLGPHLMKEERVLFPMIRKMGGPLENGGMIEGPLSVMRMEHDHVGGLLEQIDQLSGKYAVPSDGCESYRYYMEKLKEFVEDLRLHIHKENNILFARIEESH